jgi:hypothetical protein
LPSHGATQQLGSFYFTLIFFYSQRKPKGVPNKSDKMEYRVWIQFDLNILRQFNLKCFKRKLMMRIAASWRDFAELCAILKWFVAESLPCGLRHKI